MHTHPARLVEFPSRPPEAWMHTYRKLKYEVFTRELGWAVGGTPESPVAAPNEFDLDASYSFLCSEGNETFGTVRGTSLADAFPHAELFARHTRHKELAEAISSLCTLNALAVLPAFRRKRYHLLERGWVESAGRLLVFSQLEMQRAKRIGGAILTAAGTGAVRFFEGFGFRAIDPPQQTHLHHLPLTNMALCFHDERYRSAAREAGIDLTLAAPASPQIQAFSGYVDSLAF
jgi:hypothetical protein